MMHAERTHQDADIIADLSFVSVRDTEIADKLKNFVRMRVRRKPRLHTCGAKGYMTCEVRGSDSWRMRRIVNWPLDGS
jgi:hypothetical protein